MIIYNLKNDIIEFHKNTNILVGPNGIGKTNILRTIYDFFKCDTFDKPNIEIIFCNAGERILKLFREQYEKLILDNKN